MTENSVNNLTQSARKTPRTRFLLSCDDPLSPKVCSPLVSRHIDFSESPMSATTPASSDLEWENIRNGIADARKLDQDISDDTEDTYVIRAITFRTPTKPPTCFKSRSDKSAEIEMIKHLRKLDEEEEDLDATRQSLEQCFKAIFGEVTYKRLVIEFERMYHRRPRSVNYHEIIEQLDLAEQPYTHWSTIIEDAIFAALR